MLETILCYIIIGPLGLLFTVGVVKFVIGFCRFMVPDYNPGAGIPGYSRRYYRKRMFR